MSNELGAIADIATGAILARAVEPRAGEGGEQAAGRCLNCGATLAGRFCSECGQSAHIHRSIAALWHDFLHSVLHVDGKAWRTLPMLAFKPGALTRRYVQGERAKYISPLALFLFSVFLMYAVFTAVGGPFRRNVNTVRNGVPMTTAEVTAELGHQQAALQQLQQRAAALPAPDPDLAEQIADVQGDIKGLQTAERLAHGLDKDTLHAAGTHLDTGYRTFDERMRQALADPALFLFKLQFNAYKYSWALIPLSVPFVWLLFAWKRSFGLLDHAVFITYSITFMSLLLVLMALLNQAVPLAPVSSALVFVPPVHMFFQLRGAYGLGIGSALWRTFALLIIAFIVLALFAVLVLMLGLSH